MRAIDQIYKVFDAWMSASGGRGGVPILAISGAQGSGKSYLANKLAAHFGGVHLSLDDVYLTKAQRLALATTLHPLHAVRGPPGSHDLGLLYEVITSLQQAKDTTIIPLPRFDKLADDRLPTSTWHHFEGRPKVIILEGWCLGAQPIGVEALKQPINVLEETHDQDAHWRNTWNAYLGTEYASFFANIHALLFLQAPDFQTVLNWRCEQEEGLLGIAKGTLPNDQRHRIAHFIAYFERLTRHMIAGGVRATAIAHLDASREVTAISYADMFRLV
jgi:D-glycerate 3-kinase